MRYLPVTTSRCVCLLVLCAWLGLLTTSHAAPKKKAKNRKVTPKVRAVAVASSRSLKLLATAGTEKGGEEGNDGVIRVWDLETLKPKYSLFVPGAAVNSLSYDDDGSILLVGGDKGSVTAFNLKSRYDMPHSVKGKAPIRKVKFRKRDAIVVSDQFHIWNPQRDQTTAPGRLHTKEVVDIDFNYSGPLMAAAGGRETVIVHPGTLEVMPRFRFPHAQPVTAVTLCQAPGGVGLFMATGHKDGTIEYWFAGRGQRLNTFRAHRGAVTHVAFYDEDRRLVSTGADGMVRFWDIKTAKLLHSIRESRSPITCFDITSYDITDNRNVIVTSDGSTVRVRSLDPEKRKQIADERILKPFAHSLKQSK